MDVSRQIAAAAGGVAAAVVGLGSLVQVGLGRRKDRLERQHEQARIDRDRELDDLGRVDVLYRQAVEKARTGMPFAEVRAVQYELLSALVPFRAGALHECRALAESHGVEAVMARQREADEEIAAEYRRLGQSRDVFA